MHTSKYLIALVFLYSIISCNKPAKNVDLTTFFEKSGYLETPGYNKTIEYCKSLSEYSEYIHYESIGTSPQGREIPLLIINKDKSFTAEKITNSPKAKLLVTACIHAGEPDGKDAMFLLLKDFLQKESADSLLDNTIILFIPIFNVDGHERFGPYNRINQNGPKEMGWRTTAQNLNLNRDFLKADAPEMKAFLTFFHKFNPDFLVDCHVTDGADYQYHITYDLNIFGNMDEEITKWQKEKYLPYIEKYLADSGLLMTYYVAFKDWGDPRTGLRCWAASPIFSEGYAAINNRPGLLIETHMLKDYKSRVIATKQTILGTLSFLYKNGKELKSIINRNDESTASEHFRKTPYPLEFFPGSDSVIVTFKGVEYDVIKSEITGQDWFLYHKDNLKDYQIPWFNDLKPGKSVYLPEAYIIPPEWDDVINRILLHGIKINKLKNDTSLSVKTITFRNIQLANSSYEGRQLIRKYQYDESDNIVSFPKNSVLILTDQPTAKIIAHLLEPDAPNSFFRWGFFNAIFEQKEYAENYVMEKMIPEMLKNDTLLNKEFQNLIKNNPGFSSDPEAIVNWFYMKTPYWDQKLNVYPIAKISNKEIINGLKLIQ